jgi:hypothetical protein
LILSGKVAIVNHWLSRDSVWFIQNCNACVFKAWNASLQCNLSDLTMVWQSFQPCPRQIRAFLCFRPSSKPHR